MEAESFFHAESWEQLTFRDMGREEEENAWIAGTAMDQQAVTRNGWHVESVTDRHAQCNNCLGSKSTPIKCQIVPAVATMSSSNSPPTLARANEAALIEGDNQNELLLLPCQAMEHNCKFNLTSIGHRDSSDEMGDPKLFAEDQMAPFAFDGRKLHHKKRKPNEKD